jgi:hypothetical protein
MIAQRVGELCSVTSRMNSVEYIRIMEEVKLPSVNIAIGDPDGDSLEPMRFVFMQVFSVKSMTNIPSRILSASPFFTINYM